VTAKRALDLLVASLCLVLLLPLLALLYVAVTTTTRGGAIFRQTRVGAGQRSFVMYKFRTMRPDSGEKVHQDYVRRLMSDQVQPVNGLYKLDGDTRVTRLGALLRRTSLDELPQLVNVLRGQMSLVGPRPSLAWEVELFPGWALERFAVKPGMTGLWQVSGRSRLSLSEALRLDVEYAHHPGIGQDLVILLRTVPALLDREAR
jgi:lipopolysaccharide/colanic/teichoic acid biosynthesis glycosyltransferase